MKEVELRLRVVTPLFMGGADPRDPRGNPAEVRALGIRGALRWWLRAALGGGGWAGPAFTNTEDLWREEATVFGRVDSEHSAASPVIILVKDVADTPQPKPKEPPIRGKGQDYLLYGMHATKVAIQDARYYYPPSSTFTLCLRPRLGAEGTDAAMERACAALWLLIMLGGLGARTRRGAGCLAVESVNGWPTALPTRLPPLPTISTLDSTHILLNTLQSGLIQIRKLFFAQEPLANHPTSPFTVLHPNYFQSFVLDRRWPGSRQYPAWQAAMDNVGQSLSGFRLHDGATDTKAIAGFLAGQAQSGALTVQRAALGLPLPFFFPQLQGQRNVKAVVNWYRQSEGNTPGKDQRSASPLLIHFTALADGSLALVLTVLYQDLLPHDLAGKATGRVELREQSGDKRITPVETLDTNGYADLIGRLQDTMEADLDAPFRLVRY